MHARRRRSAHPGLRSGLRNAFITTLVKVVKSVSSLTGLWSLSVSSASNCSLSNQQVSLYSQDSQSRSRFFLYLILSNPVKRALNKSNQQDRSPPKIEQKRKTKSHIAARLIPRLVSLPGFTCLSVLVSVFLGYTSISAQPVGVVFIGSGRLEFPKLVCDCFSISSFSLLYLYNGSQGRRYPRARMDGSAIPSGQRTKLDQDSTSRIHPHNSIIVLVRQRIGTNQPLYLYTPSRLLSVLDIYQRNLLAHRTAFHGTPTLSNKESRTVCGRLPCRRTTLPPNSPTQRPLKSAVIPFPAPKHPCPYTHRTRHTPITLTFITVIQLSYRLIRLHYFFSVGQSW